LQCGLAVVNGTEDVFGIQKYAMIFYLIGKREAGDHRKDLHHEKAPERCSTLCPGCRSRSILIIRLSGSERRHEVPKESL